MATEAPNSVDVTEYQFKLHDKIQVFETIDQLKSNVNLLATASTFGLVFIGNPIKPELKVLQLQKFIDAKETGEAIQARVIPVQGIPHNIAVSCDGSLLAVNYTLNGTALVAIYDVPSFLSANISIKNVFQISADSNVQAIQILWNPVIASMFALVLCNGSLSVYNLKDIAFEFYSVDKQEQAKCACWSPKGKQIVVGFPGGKLMQYKPDLKPARTIVCPPNVHEQPFNTIAIQWLSTYQFAVVFIQEGEDMSPSLYIVNAPKTGQPTYINYYDICYSSSGPRKAQAFLTYIQSWNILLMATSNSMEVGVLGTTEAGEAPVWKQYVTPDEARIELPLTIDKQEMHPIGFAFETGSTHQLVIAEKQIPVMPMIHILSTHGLFVSFNFLNFSANAPDLCSPPRPIADTSGMSEFRPLTSAVSNVPSQPLNAPTQQVPQTTHSEVSFAVPSGATSTPAQDKKTKPLFGDSTNASNLFGNLATQGVTVSFGTAAAKPATAGSGLFGGQLAAGIQAFGQKPAAPAFGGQPVGGAQAFSQKPSALPFGSKPVFGSSAFGSSVAPAVNEPPKLQTSSSSNVQPAPQDTSTPPGIGVQNQSKDVNKPLYTVPPTYNAAQQKAVAPKETASGDLNSSSDNDALKELTKVLIHQFESELKDLSKRSKNIDISIGNLDESKEVVKKLNELEELSNQAVESTESLAADIQSLRNSLNECFVMIAETKSKLNMFENPELPDLATLSNVNQTNRRQIIKLKSLLATNEAQLQIVNQQIDAQWSNYQDMYRKSKTKMKIPSLEGVYQTLLKQKDIIARERIKINNIKSRLGVKGFNDQNAALKNDVTIESLADSILSMSLSEQVKADRSSLTEDKIKKLRSILQNRKITEIKPQRPERVGVKSDVVREMRIKMEKAATSRDGASTKPEKMEKQRIKQDTPQIIAKPTPTKPTAVHPSAQQAFSAISQQQQLQKSQDKSQPVLIKPLQTSEAPALSFNVIIKPTATSAANKESPFPAISNQSGGFNFGAALQKSPSVTPAITFGGNTLAKPTAQLPFGGTQPTNTPQLSLGIKDDKTIAKPIPALAPFGQTNVENIPQPSTNVIFQPKPMQPEKPTLSFAGISSADDTKDTKGKDSENLDVSSSKPQSEAQSKSDFKPEEKPDEKTASPFAALSLNKSTGFATGFSFGAANTNTSSNIFGGQTSIAKPTPSILGATQTSAVSNSSSQAPFLGSSAGFTPLSVASTQSSTTASSTASSFSFVSKPATESGAQTTPSAASSFSFVSKLEPALSSTTVGSSTSSVTSTTTVASSLPATTTATTSSGSPFNLNFGAASSSASTEFNFTAFAKNISATAPATTGSTPTSTSTDPTDSLLGSLNICKQSTQATTPSSTASQPSAGSVFGANVFASATSTGDTKSIFGGVTSTAPANLFLSPSFTTTTVTSTVAATSVTPAPLNLSISTAPATPVFGAQTSVSTVTTPPIFAATTSAGTSVFGSTPVATTATSVFGVSTAPTSAFATPASTAIGTTSSGFSSSASTFSFTSANVFGSGMPKPDQSVFGAAAVTSAPATSPFGSAAPQTTSPFGGSPAAQPASGGNMFGSSGGFGMQPTNTGSIFGGGSPAQQSNVFGTTATNSSSIFGGQNATSQASGGNAFGQAAFGSESSQAGGSIFGGGTASPVQPGAFSSTPAFGQSPFGGVQQQQPQQATSPFGGSTFGSGFGAGSAFGQTTAFGQSSPGGSFAQGGQSVGQSGFGSPGFPKPSFGGPATFGGSPSFGSAPTFGGGATFGSPKSTFGGFGQQSPTTFSPPTQQNNLFESLGSSETGLSFSNLAQTSSNAANAKQQFGGSSFSTWR